MSTKTSKTVRTAPARKPAKTTTRHPKPIAKRSTVVPPKPTCKPAAEPARATTKQSQLIALLQSPTGGTIDQMIALTGWQRHTVRGTISGVLRKRLGLNVLCATSTGDATRVYRIVKASAS